MKQCRSAFPLCDTASSVILCSEHNTSSHWHTFQNGASLPLWGSNAHVRIILVPKESWLWIAGWL